MVAGNQFLLLLWKNLTVSRRNVCGTIFQVVLPIAFSALLLVLRILVENTNHTEPTEWDSFTVANSSLPPEKTRILYSPNVSSINEIMSHVQNITVQHLNVTGFSTSESLLSEYELNPNNILAVVEFDGDYSKRELPASVKYSLRVAQISEGGNWLTNRDFLFFQQEGPRTDRAVDGKPNYHDTGYLFLQYTIDKSIINVKNPNNKLESEYFVRLNKMPYPPYVEDTLLTVLRSVLPLFLVLSFLVPVFQITKNIVYEKEHRLKEAMKLMGMSSAIYWLSWFVIIFIYMAMACFFFALFMSLNSGENGSVLQKSDPFLIFVFLLLYALSIMAFCFMISTIFSKATSAAFAAGVIFYIFYIPQSFLEQDYDTLGRNVKLATCLLNPMAMTWGVVTLTLYEGTGAGARWTNFHEPATKEDNFSLLMAMVMLLVDTCIYSLAAWYLENVRPGEFGIPKPWYFPCMKSYWCGTKHKEELMDVTSGHLDDNTFESDPTDLKIGINISHLRKEFGRGSKRKAAVVDTTLNMYEGQITVLLGHNGAGKTTTMSMLTGFIPPTKGTAIINGCDIRKDIDGVRKSIGLCPQHNILFDNLTVEEHLWFFAKLKGYPSKSVKQEVSRTLNWLGIASKSNSRSSALSGGMKRKLSVGIALIADSKVVILDEPTSGMDPSARRETWEVLQKVKEGRTLILTTHFMDEADLLGDRIAIMAEGVVKCCGTSLFLKKAYGAGYHLVIVKSQDCDVDKVTSLITRHIPQAVMEGNVSAELSYLLPFEESPKFETLFEDLSEKAASLGLSSFGTTATTMEEVFLRVGEDTKPEDVEESESNGHANLTFGGDKQAFSMQQMNGQSLNIYDSFVKNKGIKWAFQQFYGMFVKKALYSRRRLVVTLTQLILPVVFTVLAFLSVQATPEPTEAEPALKLDLTPFGTSSVVVYNISQDASPEVERLSQVYKELFTSYTTERADSKVATFDDFLVNKADEVGIATFRERYPIAAFFNDSGNTVQLIAYFNGQPLHTPAIALTYLMNTLLKEFTNTSHSITTYNHPLPRSLEDKSDAAATTALAVGFTVAFFVLFGMAFLSSSFILFMIKERCSGAKHLQKVSGVSSFAYWLSNYCWDLLNYLIVVVFIMVVFAAFQSPAYVEDSRLGLVFLLFFIYGLCCLPFVYTLHFLFSTPSTGMVVITILNIVTGLIALLAVFILKIPSLDTESIGSSLDWIFTILVPHYCLGQALNNIYVNYDTTKTCEDFNYQQICPLVSTFPCCSGCTSGCLVFQENYLAWENPGILKYIVFMLGQMVLFLFIVMGIEYGVLTRLMYFLCNQLRGISGWDEECLINDSEDGDVKEERERIEKSPLTKLMEGDALIIRNLSKSYGSVRAVRRICVGVSAEECFGLLGQNGAGKTTTFKMLTGDERVDNGNAYLNSYDVIHHLKKVQQNLGYCPQFDALIDQMTGRETLTMYARLRGVPEDNIRAVVEDLMHSMTLMKHADKVCADYSGGNKRKLSTAIALIGDPAFILLDEPTTGMDPGARRKVWNILSEVRARGRTLILTSHSMEECDALCTKIVIMVNGKFVCFGSPQHLKNKFGQGYTLVVRLGISPEGQMESSDAVKNHILQNFPNTKVFETYQGYVNFQIPDSSIPLSRLFGTMERVKNQCRIGDYSIQQTSLEQVFLSFTRDQVMPIERKKRCLCC